MNDRLRILVDSCDNVQGFMINHAMAGGAGSGVASLILDTIACDYRKKLRLISKYILAETCKMQSKHTIVY